MSEQEPTGEQEPIIGMTKQSVAEDLHTVVTRRLLELDSQAVIPSGILHCCEILPYRIAEFDGAGLASVCDQVTWAQLYLELYNGRRPGIQMPSPDDIRPADDGFDEPATVPIALAHFRYHTPRKSFIARIRAAVREGRQPELPHVAAVDEVLEERRGVFATALLPTRFVEFTRLPYIHYGLTVRFVLPRELYLTNISGAPERVEVDFDDGEGFRDVPFDQVTEITYDDDLERLVRMRIGFKSEMLLANFRFRLSHRLAPKPDDQFEIALGGTIAGWAWIYYGNRERRLRYPVIFTDGFGSGSTNLDTIWQYLQSPFPFVTNLLQQNNALVILGFREKDARIQANAEVAIKCIQEVIKRREGNAKLVVIGPSGGGLVTRYALAKMEKLGIDHQTGTYVSYDAPHLGAWVPLIIQYFVHYFADKSEGARELSRLMNSQGSQQLLRAHVPRWDYDGLVSWSPLRQKFLQELEDWGWFPNRPKKLGVVNGTANGTGNGVPAGVKAFEWHRYNDDGSDAKACAVANTQPAWGTRQDLGWLWRKDRGKISYVTTNVAPFDGAPGGWGAFFGGVIDNLRGAGYRVDAFHRNTCFVPSVSAVSFKGSLDFNLNLDISNLRPDQTDLDEYKCSSSNTQHALSTAELGKWILEKIDPSVIAAESEASTGA
jgi:hypothetical protein